MLLVEFVMRGLLSGRDFETKEFINVIERRTLVGLV